MTSGPAPTASGARASTCSRASTRASRAWASTTSTSSLAPLRPADAAAETMGALDSAVRAGKALYVGSTPTRRSAPRGDRDPQGAGHAAADPPALYSLLNRWVEDELLDVLEHDGVGAIVFSPLGQGLLTDRYLNGIPEDSRVSRGEAFARAAQRGEPRARTRAQRDRARGAGSRSRSSRSPGCCAISA